MSIILPSITTYMTPDWSERIKSLDKLNLTQIALFLTGLEKLEDRKKLYELLSQTNLKSIPHVHLRDDMQAWELDLLSEKFQTKLFNVHARPSFQQLIDKNPRYKGSIYVENGREIDDYFISFLSGCAGLCVDFSHWAVGNFLPRPGYNLLADLARKYKVGCAHASAFVPTGRKFGEDENDVVVQYSPHSFEKLAELDYLVDFKEFLPEYVSLELVNPLKEHLEAIDYLQKILQG